MAVISLSRLPLVSTRGCHSLVRRSEYTSTLIPAVNTKRILKICPLLNSSKFTNRISRERRVHASISDGSLGPQADSVITDATLIARVISFASDQFLPIALISGVSLGYAWPTAGKVANAWGVQKLATFGIFFISGLNLKWGEVMNAFQAWPAFLYGLVSILLLTPLVSLLALRLPLTPKDLAAGLALFCCVPTTLSTGIYLTQTVGANAALAVALTVSSNLIGIATVPIVLSRLVSAGAGVHLPARSLLKSLLQTLLLPLLMGMAANRFIPGVRGLVASNRKLLSMASSIQLSLVPWMQISVCHSVLSQVSFSQLSAAGVAGIFLHIAFLLFNTLAVNILPLTAARGQEKLKVDRTIILVASQKTLPVAVAVVTALDGALGIPGLLLLPCIATQLTQTIFDSILVSFWLKEKEALPDKKFN